jgi:TonB family protein
MKIKPIPVAKKKIEISPVKEEEKKESPPPARLEEKTAFPLNTSDQEAELQEVVKKEEGSANETNPEMSNAGEIEGKSLREAEKQEESGAAGPGAMASGLPLEASSEPGKLPAFAGATWVGEMGRPGREGPGGKNIGEGKKAGLEASVTERPNPLGSSKKGKGHANLASYLGTARMRIEQAKRYPSDARREKWEGKVVLSFQINRNGEILEINLIQSSGHRVLDEEGMETLRRASPFPSPLLIEKEKLVLEVPILFRLESGR